MPVNEWCGQPAHHASGRRVWRALLAVLAGLIVLALTIAISVRFGGATPG